MREQRLVRRNAVEHARDEKRRMEPAAMLVGTLEIQVGGEARLRSMRGAHDRVVRGAGVEPDVQRVAALLVIRPGIAAEALPCLDAVLLYALRNALQQLRSTRMQSTRLAVQEERHWHAPLALPGERPVRPIRDHAVQPRL